MKKALNILMVFVLIFVGLVGCKNETSVTVSEGSSAHAKEEIELMLEETAWKMEGINGYLLFTNDKRVTIYDFSLLDGANQEASKFLTYETGKNEQGFQTIAVSFLRANEEKTLFTYNKDTNVFATSDKTTLHSASVSDFIHDYIKKIKDVESKEMDEFTSQADMNVRAGILCGYWNELHEALKMHLKTILSVNQYDDFVKQAKMFESQRDKAVQEAGKDVEGGSLYPVVTGGAYCTQTEKEIQRILTQYYQ